MPRILSAFIALVLLSAADAFPTIDPGTSAREHARTILVIAALTTILPALFVRWVLRPALRYSGLEGPGPTSLPWTGRVRSARRIIAGMPLLGLFASIIFDAPGFWASEIPPHFAGAPAALCLAPFLIGWCLAEREWWRFEASRAPLGEGVTRAMLRQMRPVFLILGVSTVLRASSDIAWLAPELREWTLTHPAAGVGSTLFLIGAMLFLSPYLIGLIHKRRPLPEGPLRERFAETARAAGTGLGKIHVWETGPHPTLNACVTGALPGQRRVFFTDGIIDALNEDELAGVFAHELAHSKLHHLWIYTGLVLALIGITLGIEPWLVELAENTRFLPPTSGAIDVSLLILVGGFFFVFFGNLSRHLESQADLFSADTTGSPAGIASALQRIGHLTGSLGRRPGWRHPSIPQRITTLMTCAVDPAARRRFDRRSRRLLLAWAVVLLLGGIGGASALLHTVEVPAWQRQMQKAEFVLFSVLERKSRPWVDDAWVEQEAERARGLLVEALEDPGSRFVRGAFDDRPRRGIFRNLAYSYDLLHEHANRAAALYLAETYRVPVHLDRRDGSPRDGSPRDGSPRDGSPRDGGTQRPRSSRP